MGNCALHVTPLADAVPGTISVIYQPIWRALLLLAGDVFLAKRSFIETDFEHYSYGHKVGPDFFLKLDVAPENQTEALARERRSMNERDFAKPRRHLIPTRVPNLSLSPLQEEPTPRIIRVPPWTTNERSAANGKTFAP